MDKVVVTRLQKLEKQVQGASQMVTLRVVAMLLVGLLATVGLVLGCIAISQSSTRCGCPSSLGKTTFNVTNGTVTTNQTIQSILLFGQSGVKTLATGPQRIDITNLRDLSAYVVSPDGDSEYLTPQDAYMAAVAANDVGAIIMILPGTYSYGTTQLQITMPGVSFVATASVSNSVIFTADSSSGGIRVDVPLSADQNYASFQGITFGALGDRTGFLLNITGGQTVLRECSASDSNFRISVGGLGNFSILAAIQSSFNTLPPDSFITTLDAATVVFMEDVTMTQLGFGAPVSPGGYIVDMSAGIAEARLVNNHFVFSSYYGVLRGPNPGVAGESSITVDKNIVINNDGGYPGVFIDQSGQYQGTIHGSNINMKGNIVRQNQSSLTGEQHQLLIQASILYSDGPSFYANPDAVLVIGDNTLTLSNCYVRVNNPLFISIPNSTIPDTLVVKIGGMLLETTGPPSSVCGEGPTVAASIIIGSSTCTNGANAFIGFTYTAATPL